MRIGIDCRLWGETGVGRYLRNLVAELRLVDQENEYVLFILPKDKDDSGLRFSDSRVTVKQVAIRWHTLDEQVRFSGIIEKENVDLMHFPYFSVPLFYKKPFVVTIHDLIINHYPTGQASTLPYPMYWVKLQVYKYIISQAAKRAASVIAVSKATRDEIVQHFFLPEQKITITYEGVDTAVKSAADKECRVDVKNYFLYVGNAYPHKNLKSLITAFSIIRQDHADLSLVLIGKDDFFSRRLQKEHRKTPGLIFKTVAGDKELSCYYKHARALVMPSFMEGFGLPPLEAMANNCLVLCSDIPSLREVCDTSAIYFDPTNISELAERMSGVISFTSKEKDRFLQRGAERVEDFSWRKMAEETLMVYKQSVVNSA